LAPPLNGERYILFLAPTRFGLSSAQRAAAKGPIYAPFEHTATPTQFYKSTIKWIVFRWALRDATVYEFGDNAPLLASYDPFTT
jgi:hypothetical protein